MAPVLAVYALGLPFLSFTTVALRGFYALPRRDIAKALRALTGIDHVTIEDRDAVLSALTAFEAGMDLADALHVARCPAGGQGHCCDPRHCQGQAASAPTAKGIFRVS